MLTVTVVAAKNIPKLDTFTESDPYAVLIIEGSANYGDEHQEPFGRTRTKKNQPHPVWEEHFEIETVRSLPPFRPPVAEADGPNVAFFAMQTC